MANKKTGVGTIMLIAAGIGAWIGDLIKKSVQPTKRRRK